MKKHLFYSLLGVFVLTALVTLGGITDIIQVKEPYLGFLVTAFLIESAGVLYTVIKGTDFYSDTPVSQKFTKARIQALERPTLPTEPKKNVSDIIDAPKVNGLHFRGGLDFYERLKKLSDRPAERDHWINNEQGKKVDWDGYFYDLAPMDAESHPVMMTLGIVPEGVHLIFVHAPKHLKDLIYSFKQGDIIRCSGRLTINFRNPIIVATDIQRVSN